MREIVRVAALARVLAIVLAVVDASAVVECCCGVGELWAIYMCDRVTML